MRRVQERDAVPVLERDAPRGHDRDLRPSVPERDGGLVHHAAARGFAEIPAATTLFRRGISGLVRRATARGTVKAFSTRRTGRHDRGLLRRPVREKDPRVDRDVPVVTGQRGVAVAAECAALP